jgi:hypothetical protein
MAAALPRLTITNHLFNGSALLNFNLAQLSSGFSQLRAERTSGGCCVVVRKTAALPRLTITNHLFNGSALLNFNLARPLKWF